MTELTQTFYRLRRGVNAATEAIGLGGSRKLEAHVTMTVTPDEFDSLMWLGNGDPRKLFGVSRLDLVLGDIKIRSDAWDLPDAIRKTGRACECCGGTRMAQGSTPRAHRCLDCLNEQFIVAVKVR